MRLPKLLFTAAAVSLAALAAAQTPEGGEPQGLSDLNETVQGLEDEAVPAEETPAAPEQEQQEEQAAPAQEPEETTPAPAPPAATAPARPAEPLTDEQVATLDRNVRRGRLLFSIARAGLIATQDMLSRVSDPEGAGITGWIVEPEGNGSRVTFYGAGAESPVAIYQANVLGGRVTSREIHLGDDKPALSPLQARMAAARDGSESADQQACGGQALNVLVVPPADADAPIDVYRVSPQSARGRYPLGGHYRSTVAADGTVSEARAFAAGCTDIEVPEVAAGEQPRPIAVTHTLDPLPTEMHVYLSLWTGRPLLVVTGDPQRVWLVTGERIAQVRQ